METKRNLKYFTSKGITPLGIISLAVALIGFVCLCVGQGLGFIGLIGIGVGLGTYMFVNGGKASGDDIEYQVGEKEKDMRERGMIRFELFDKSLKFK